MFRKILVLLCAAVWIGGCGIDPDGESGNNQRRDLAQPLPMGEWLTDENGVDYAKGDRSDWWRFSIPRDGMVFVDVSFDNNDAEIVAVLYDRYGRMLAEKVKPRGISDPLKFEGNVPKGKYFVQVYARATEDNSVYSIRATLQGGAGIGGDIPPPE